MLRIASSPSRLALRVVPLIVIVALFLLGSAASTDAARVVMEDGRILQGGFIQTPGIAEPPLIVSGSDKPVLTIWGLDDGLRRTFISRRLVKQSLDDEAGEAPAEFELTGQTYATSGDMIGAVGPVMRAGPFDERGRRILTVDALGRSPQIIQAITEVTPTYVRLQGVNKRWDMRVGTSSYSREFLNTVLGNFIDMKSVDNRLKLVSLYYQAERYQDAAAELERLLNDFENNPKLQEQAASTLRALKQFAAERLLDEMKLRRDAGQHDFALSMLKKFPSEGVAGETLQAVRQMIEEYELVEQQRVGILEHLKALIAELADPTQKERCEAVLKELETDLDPTTISRMNAYGLRMNDMSATPEIKLALAISGWIVGANTAIDELPVALSMVDTRDLVSEYMASTSELERKAILEALAKQEAATCAYVAAMLKLMKPPVATDGLNVTIRPADVPENGDETIDPEAMLLQEETPANDRPGFFVLDAPSYGNLPPYRYMVQLPPEYDPDRLYPTIVSLHGMGGSPETQLLYWCGPWQQGGWRKGQAGRYGYIVIAPYWEDGVDRKYSYSAREHGAVDYCLRDACRRFSIDTDRVFLAGFSAGGDAAWDIGLAHPDIWAGVLPISATADRYVSRYWENARYVPMYLVIGEHDGKRMEQNAVDIDRYLKRGFDVTVVEYRGRGHETFYEEIHRLFDWMNRRKRDFFLKEFEVGSMRWWDNKYWWVEVDDMPERAMVDPYDWPPGPKAAPAVTEGRVTANNGLIVRSGGQRTAVWISPELVDFEQRTTITVDGKRISPSAGFIEGDLKTLLYDARTRADRQNVFWLRLEN